MNRTAEERPDEGRKTVLIVEDDPGTQRVLASGLATSLGMFDVLTANHGQEAVELLESHPIDVVVTDLAMPVMDGFALIGYLTNLGTTMPVVVLSALAPTTVADGLDGYGGLIVLRKPAGYHEVARAVLEALERHAMGQVAGIPLASVLQLVEAERRTCSLGVTSGRRRGRLHFESGRLINAFSDDFGAEGEAAAYDILTWSRTAIEFERLPEGVRRTIDMPTQTLLIEVARRQDEQREREARLTPATPKPPTPSSEDDAAESGAGRSDAPDVQPDDLAPTESAPEAPIDAATYAAPLGEPDSESERDAAVEPDFAAAPERPISDPITMPDGDDSSIEPEGEPALASAATAPTSGDAMRTEPHTELVTAIERLVQRVHTADTALAAVADEVDAFHAAQRRYDDEVARQEDRRRAVEDARRDVADLARQILARMDGLFDVFDGDPQKPPDAADAGTVDPPDA